VRSRQAFRRWLTWRFFIDSRPLNKISIASAECLPTSIAIGSVADPDPHHFGKLYPDPHHIEKLDPDLHQSKEQDPDPHQSEKVEAVLRIRIRKDPKHLDGSGSDPESK